MRWVTQPVVVIGAGGMGRCILDVLHEVNTEALQTGEPHYELVGVLDDGTADNDLLRLWDTKHLGPVTNLEDLPSDVAYLIGVGEGQVRRRLDAYGQSVGHPSPEPLVHPNAHQGRGVWCGPGSVVCSHVSMENNVRLGRHVHVNQNSTIGHDSRLADYVTVSPLVAVSGNTDARESAFFGTGASVRQGLTVGADAIVAMSAAVIRDVAAGMTVAGVPARSR